MPKLIEKGTNIRLCNGLTSDEFACKCKHEACRSTIVSKRFLEAYRAFREYIKEPLKVNSGYRCIQHNFDVGGRPLSRHTTGEAIDIALDSFTYLNHEEIEHAAKISGFTFVYFGKGFVHMDVR